MSFFENTRKPAGLGGKIYDGAGAGKGRPPTPVEKTTGEPV